MPRYIFRHQRKWFTSPLLIFALTAFILSGLFVTQGFRRGDVKPLFMPTPTPTRIPASYAQEAETNFQAGNLDAAITSYQQAIASDLKNGRLYAEMARILTYSTETQTTGKAKQERFAQAEDASKKAAELSPEDSLVFAIRGFVLDWDAGFTRFSLKDDQAADRLLNEAEQTINKALTLDETNIIAQVYYAEIMVDQSRWDLAKGAIDRALAASPNLWEAHRVNALYLENQAEYLASIEAYKRAAELAPNITFLQIKLGQAYRNMGLKTGSGKVAEDYYNEAIKYFDQVAKRNETMGIKDPLPYLGIGRAYGQLGEFFAASRNMNKALQYDPENADVYAQLGMVFRQARNYEDAIKALGCAVSGCNADVTCDLRNCNKDLDPPISIEKMPLNGTTIVYYYTYASLLAGMWLPRHPVRSQYCIQAGDVISEIKISVYGTDQTILEILAPSESICSSAAETAIPTEIPSPTPTPTPTKKP
jgi:tetratricopeptide (TPR) repeat protein